LLSADDLVILIDVITACFSSRLHIDLNYIFFQWQYARLHSDAADYRLVTVHMHEIRKGTFLLTEAKIVGRARREGWLVKSCLCSLHVPYLTKERGA